MARDGILRRVGLGHHRGPQAPAQGGGDRGHMRRGARRAQLSAQPRQDTSGRQGGEHSADRERDGQAGRLRERFYQVSREQLCRDALLDGPRGHIGHG